ncbi:MAG TPA: hypothetical protein VNL17_14280 [Verrucomicrobiae bacterium]|nr:hypothetical protein [Verrucomicrobiae bacterium]
MEIFKETILDREINGDRVPISFDIGDAELRKAFKRLCEDRGTDMASVLIAYIKQEVAEKSQEKPPMTEEDRIVNAVRLFLKDCNRKPVALRLFRNMLLEMLKPYM